MKMSLSAGAARMPVQAASVLATTSSSLLFMPIGYYCRHRQSFIISYSVFLSVCIIVTEQKRML